MNNKDFLKPQIKKFKFHFLLLLITFHVSSQVIEPTQWIFSTSKSSISIGEDFDLIFSADIEKDWYLYSSDFDPNCGPVVTDFEFQSTNTFELIGKIIPINPIKKFDDIFGCEVKIFKEKGVFKQRIKILKPSASIVGEVNFQVCSDLDGKCIPFTYDFNFNNFNIESNPNKIIAEQKQVTRNRNLKKPLNNNETKDTTAKTKDKISVDRTLNKNEGPIMDDNIEFISQENESIFWFMIFSFIAGWLALLTPCVFPLIPMTVSYFVNKKRHLALIYGFSIIIIYSILGSIIAPLMGPETANHLATEWLPNLIFFFVFILFALSFFGLFDITIPNNLISKIDSQGDKKGLIGVFFMAFTLVLVSFSCTGPLVGSILVSSAGGNYIKPIAGMFSFSLAFAIPFSIFAFFPSWLNSIPKSGGWLNQTKVTLGFIELALAFKFLSVADQAFHWGILDRDIYITIWIVIFTMMGFYLLGKIRLPNDSKNQVVGVKQLILAMATFTFVIYLIPGLWGAPLKALAGYLPPLYTHDFNLTSKKIDDDNYILCDETPIYSDFLHLPHGLKGYFDYNQAINCAKIQKKPVFIDFTGHGCTNCREMEAVVWSDPRVLEILKNEYIILALYVDDKTILPKDKWYTSSYDNKVKKTIGKQNADLQIRRLNNNAQPFYVLLGLDEKVLLSPKSYDKDVSQFISFLNEGIKKHRSKYLSTTNN